MTKGKPKTSGLGVRWRGDAVAIWRGSFLKVPDDGHALYRLAQEYNSLQRARWVERGTGVWPQINDHPAHNQAPRGRGSCRLLRVL